MLDANGTILNGPIQMGVSFSTQNNNYFFTCFNEIDASGMWTRSGIDTQTWTVNAGNPYAYEYVTSTGEARAIFWEYFEAGPNGISKAKFREERNNLSLIHI